MKIVFILLMAGIVARGQARPQEPLLRHPVRGTRGAVAGGSDYAVEAGMRILQTGGNAVDAGVATMLAASVTEFSHFGFGGEAPIVIRTREGKVVAIAGVGTMPKEATADFFRHRQLGPGETYVVEPNGLKYMVPVHGIMSALVPGMVDAALLSLREFGTLSFAQVVAPAIEYADGEPVDGERVQTLRAVSRILQLWPTSSRVFLPNGRPPQPGDIFRQADLARTLRSMADAEKKALQQGAGRQAAIDAIRDFFYRGDIARRIDAFSRKEGGLLRYEDMAAFHLTVEDAVSTDYHGYTVYKPGFWSQGPTMLEALNILDGIDLAAMGQNSAEYIHTLTETLKLAYADRDTYYGDPKFVNVPESMLLSREYSAARRKLLTARASLDFRPGAIGGKAGRHPAAFAVAKVKIDDALMARDTTCVNVIDQTGMVFSSTPSGSWLPSVIAGDTGIPLTQRAQSFLLIPGHPNELAGGKRPRVTLSPTLVTRQGKPVIAIATPGGDNQEQCQLQVLLNVIEFAMNAERAVEEPRFQTRHLVSSFDNHAMSPGDLQVDERIPASVVRDLLDRGHRIASRSRWNSEAAPTAIRILPNGVMEAGADPYAYRAARAW
jgi:gamma-glutamyltranspeptidase / glutathione hydrolase